MQPLCNVYSPAYKPVLIFFTVCIPQSTTLGIESVVLSDLECNAFRIEEGDAVVAVVTQHKRSYEELQKALRNAHLEVPYCPAASLLCITSSLAMHLMRRAWTLVA